MDGIDVGQLMHDTRTAYLRDLDISGKVMISIGANDAGYFSWIHHNSGQPARHIGVEFYMPEPESLPERCEWVANSAGDMHGIGDAVGDVLFSGQNIEHLWEEEVVGFLMEANRVLKPGGLIVVDSPNRAITELLCIVHPEHMVEILPNEMAELFAAAGFEPGTRRGIYLCRDPRNRQTLPYQPERLLGGAWSASERLALSDSHIDDCYIWWMEARKVGPADVERLRVLVRRYWEIGWPERMNRLQTSCGVGGEDGAGLFYQSAADHPGAVAYGPYAPIKRGRYRVSANVALAPGELQLDPSTVVGTLDVLLGLDVVAQIGITVADLRVDTYSLVSADIETTLETSFGFQWRVISNGRCGMKVERRTRVELIA